MAMMFLTLFIWAWSNMRGDIIGQAASDKWTVTRAITAAQLELKLKEI